MSVGRSVVPLPAGRGSWRKKPLPTLEVTVDQVLALVEQLAPVDKYLVLRTLSIERERWWEAMHRQGEQHLRQLCATRGLDWDRLSDEERQIFIDDLLHEGKYYRCMYVSGGHGSM